MHTITNMQNYETLINGLIDKGFGSCDAFLDSPTLLGLRNKLLHYHHEGSMHPAGIGKNFDYQKNAAIRGDVIRWIDPESDDPHEQVFLAAVNEFVSHLNATCYTGINGYEFHYAYYETGSFYKRHLDRFKNDRGRKFSFVLYLNENWQEPSNGGLSLYLENEEVRLYPLEGRVVFFRSDQTEHEVHPSSDRPRLSIAGWLKRI